MERENNTVKVRSYEKRDGIKVRKHNRRNGKQKLTGKPSRKDYENESNKDLFDRHFQHQKEVGEDFAKKDKAAIRELENEDYLNGTKDLFDNEAYVVKDNVKAVPEGVEMWKRTLHLKKDPSKRR